MRVLGQCLRIRPIRRRRRLRTSAPDGVMHDADRTTVVSETRPRKQRSPKRVPHRPSLVAVPVC